jgi:uncharacterized protein (DUF983 family)
MCFFVGIVVGNLVVSGPLMENYRWLSASGPPVWLTLPVWKALIGNRVISRLVVLMLWLDLVT